jgi:hypothetical protein
MSNWELTRQKFPTKYDLNKQERAHLPYTTRDSFATNVWEDRILFAHFRNEAIYSQGVGHTWKFEEDRELVSEQTLWALFVDYRLVDNLDPFIGTTDFWGKEIKYNRRDNRWVYHNNRPVNFHTPSEHNMPVEEEDTAQVEELLESTEWTIITAT